jgi:octaprenyl-diphosphate synthase
MCRFKTGSLASLAAIAGARAAAASDHTAGALGAAWEDLGTGFQILDDVKNLTTGNPGKHRGDDVVEGKKSLPVIFHASDRPDDREKLARLFERAAVETPGGDWSAVEEAIGILTDSGAVAEAGRRGKEILEKGRSVLEERLPDGNGRQLSLGLVDAFITKML